MFEGLQKDRMQEDKQGAKKHGQKYKSTLNQERSMEKQCIMTLQN